MRYRRFGKTELQMPVFSCGGMRYQHKWQDVSPSEVPKKNQQNLEATIHRAIELGIYHIETARGYGTSEMQLGWILPRLNRDQIIVQTKVAPFSTQGEFQKTFETSMTYLKLDYVDLLSIHGINNRQLLDWTIRKNGCLEVAQKLKKEGRVRHIGFSTHATPEIILETIQTDEFDYMNVHWYFVNDFNWRSIVEADHRDMGVFIISPNDKGGRLYDPPKKLSSLCAPLSPMVFNDLYCLSRNEIHTLSLGASCPSDFDEHLKALDHYDEINKIIDPIEDRLRSEMNRLLGKDWCQNWWKGIPEYENVPGQINLIEILRLWTFAKSLDLVEWAKMRYNLLGNGDHWFPGENANHLPEGLNLLLKQSRFSDQILEILKEAHCLLFEKAQTRLSESD